MGKSAFDVFFCLPGAGTRECASDCEQAEMATRPDPENRSAHGQTAQGQCHLSAGRDWHPHPAAVRRDQPEAGQVQGEVAQGLAQGPQPRDQRETERLRAGSHISFL